MSTKQRVAVAMSGGVDSSVATHLLLEEGYECVGVTLQLFDTGQCGAPEAISAARGVAEQLGIAHHVVDGRERFAEKVLRPAWQEYARGRTPNPCVICNEEIKFGLLSEFARSLGIPLIATGHYARLRPAKNGAVELWRGLSREKDQSYFLFALSEAQRAACLMLLGALTKQQVRDIARERGLMSAERSDSQDACFATNDRTFPEELRRFFDEPAQAGPVLDDEGNVVGQHTGLHQYTIGQRHGLGIALGERAWVREIDAVQRRVVLTTDANALMARGLETAGARWLATPEARDCQVQIRYRHKAVPARVTPLDDDRFRVEFAEPQRAVTPGQAAVLYDDERVLAGGWIDRAL
ncbi:MAG: tRNA 2-thiouridine(34) synthase MnmA [Candidatus Lernaella stagnicola]|nr:tRNA 2-thiouridine(34) synthase MnmA [Candidatus Lernaella stagnicola]